MYTSEVLSKILKLVESNLVSVMLCTMELEEEQTLWSKI